MLCQICMVWTESHVLLDTIVDQAKCRLLLSKPSGVLCLRVQIYQDVGVSAVQCFLVLALWWMRAWL